MNVFEKLTKIDPAIPKCAFLVLAGVVLFMLAFAWMFSMGDRGMMFVAPVVQDGRYTEAKIIRDINFEEACYYSLTTLTTVGFGDITPSSVLARRVTMGYHFLTVVFVVVLIPTISTAIGKK